jgi:hypothetical protein
MPYRQQAAELLAEWRAAERALEAAIDGSAEREGLQFEVERLRREYNLLVDLQRDAHGPPLPEEPSVETA